MLSAPPYTHDHTDEYSSSHDNPQQVLEDEGAGIGAGYDVGDEAINDDKGDHADYDSY